MQFASVTRLHLRIVLKPTEQTWKAKQCENMIYLIINMANEL